MPYVADSLLQTATRVGMVRNDDVSATPTDAEFDTAFGDAASQLDGFVGLLDDNGAGTTLYAVFQKGSAWFYVALTKAT